MAENRDSPEDLFDFAQALVRKLKRRHQLEWDEHRAEDAVQDLFLAGWQVWRDQANVGLAKNRMVSRTANLLRDCESETKHEPTAASDLLTTPAIDKSGELWDEDAVRAWDVPPKHEWRQEDPAERARINDYLKSLPPRRRKVIRLRMADYTNEEIAAKLGVSLRTVERELANARKEHKNDEQE